VLESFCARHRLPVRARTVRYWSVAPPAWHRTGRDHTLRGAVPQGPEQTRAEHQSPVICRRAANPSPVGPGRRLGGHTGSEPSRSSGRRHWGHTRSHVRLGGPPRMIVWGGSRPEHVRHCASSASTRYAARRRRPIESSLEGSEAVRCRRPAAWLRSPRPLPVCDRPAAFRGRRSSYRCVAVQGFERESGCCRIQILSRRIS